MDGRLAGAGPVPIRLLLGTWIANDDLGKILVAAQDMFFAEPADDVGAWRPGTVK